MHLFVKSMAVSALLSASAGVNAFVVEPTVATYNALSGFPPSNSMGRSDQQGARLSAGSSNYNARTVRLNQASDSSDSDEEIERLRSMATKLRAEAAALEAEKAQALADAAEMAFERFDTNKDGEISLNELQDGLEKSLKIELSESRARELMEAFDASGDGALQKDEMVTIDRFRNKLESLVREEKRLAADAKKQAQKEEEEAKLAEAKLEILNEKPPTNSDKVLSILPYLFPLMDGLQYGRFLLQGDDAGSNPFVVFVAVLYTLYRSIPFSGFLAFFALNFLGGTPSLNRLIRFNMQQAIFIDIALFFPGLLAGIFSVAGNAAGLNLPGAVTELTTDAVFVSLLLVLGYCAVSSLLGAAPDKIPILSSAVLDRMPTIDMFDDQGRFVPRDVRETDEEDKDKKDKK